eukprot:TRINITY_DN3962_c0_g2_i1.p1 TRINITY_DN3962_c0_g2~~TRINITY_DN3962_c0_g2_i1.p1  ORF type:complete len:124 (-),score=12.88 TRINITY_DN3962_c0_g2_i1:88-459(-)
MSSPVVYDLKATRVPIPGQENEYKITGEAILPYQGEYLAIYEDPDKNLSLYLETDEIEGKDDRWCQISAIIKVKRGGNWVKLRTYRTTVSWSKALLIIGNKDSCEQTNEIGYRLELEVSLPFN